MFSIKTLFIFMIAGFIIGLMFLFASFYYPETIWRSTFRLHHGLLGVAGFAFGSLIKSSAIVGFSIGLVVSDINDFPWGV